LKKMILIVVALLSCMVLTLILIQYYVAGPLFREVQKLKEEIDSLKKE
jgi:ABC-type microcin C transport system permease subunit YejB